MVSCSICIASTNHPHTLFENESWVVILANEQTYLGRCYVTLKSHKGSLSELTLVEWQELHEIISKFEKVVTKSFKSDLFNWSCLMNDAYRENVSPNPHVHWHVKPRYRKQVIINGVIFRDNEFGKHYRTKWDGRSDHVVDEATMTVIKQEIVKNL